MASTIASSQSKTSEPSEAAAPSDASESTPVQAQACVPICLVTESGSKVCLTMPHPNGEIYTLDPYFGAVHAKLGAVPERFVIKSTASFASEEGSAQGREHHSAFDPCVLLHILAKGRSWLWLEVDVEDPQSLAFHQQKVAEKSVLIVQTSCVEAKPIDQDICLYPVATQERLGFIVYAIDAGALCVPPDTAGLLQNSQLGLVFGVEYTLARVFDLTNPPPRETEFAMLKEFDETGRITLPGGVQIAAALEPTLVESELQQALIKVDDAESGSVEGVKQDEGPPAKRLKSSPACPSTGWRSSMGDVVHPVLHLNSPQGQVVFTKFVVDEEQTVRSIMIHVRPGWRELRSYLVLGTSANDRKLESDEAKRPLFKVTVLFKQARPRREALEIWRCLDPQETLFSLKTAYTVSTNIRSVETGLVKRSLDFALKPVPWELPLSFGVDNSSRWTGTTGIDRIWPVRPYMPYVEPNDAALATTLHAMHALRNEFFFLAEKVSKDLKLWMQSGASWYAQTPPLSPSVAALISVQKNRWLQEFQSSQSNNIPKELLAARDYADPILRNKWHLVIDTNVLHSTFKENYEFFNTMRHSHSERVVIVIPFATVHELDWQKHKSSGEKKMKAASGIRFINSQVASGSNWIVLQSHAEDKPNEVKHQHLGNFNATNDMRVFECAKARHQAGCKTMLVSNDTNLRNIALAAGVPSARFQALWKMMCDHRYQNLGPEHWLRVLEKIEKAKAMR